MFWKPKSTRTTPAALGSAALVAVLTLGLAACEEVLEVDTPGAITADELLGPAALPFRSAGVVGDFNRATDTYVLYSGLLTDEFIHAGTFPTRRRIDNQSVIPDNATLTVNLEEPIQVARNAADELVEDFVPALDDPEFAELESELRRAIVFGYYYGARSRQYLAELYCQSTIDTLPPISSDARMEEALVLFQQAEEAAVDAELETYANAARVGQGRALLWLKRYDEAAAAVQEVVDERDFVLFAEHSSNASGQYNDIFEFTTGLGNEVIRWTIGDGEQIFEERWPYFDQFAGLGLIDPITDLDAFNTTISVQLQLQYISLGSDVPIASWAEARLIQAEVAIRQGRTEDAEDILNDLRSDFIERFEAEFHPLVPRSDDLEALGIEPIFDLEPIELTGDFEQDLRIYAQERARELWLRGDRQYVLRRFLDDGINLYPNRAPGFDGDDICLPISRQEIDNNPNIP